VGHLHHKISEHSARFRQPISLPQAADARVLVHHSIIALNDHALPAALLAFNNQFLKATFHSVNPVI
jgi:hypothetical protein